MLDYSIFFTTPSSNLKIVRLDDLNLSTGFIYCCDPFLSEEVNSLEINVKPGVYPVSLCIANVSDWGRRVALAAITFSEHHPISWQEAFYLLNGEAVSGFPVDAGLACFMDAQTRQQFVEVVDDYYAKNPDGNYYDDILSGEFKRHADVNNPYDCGDWNVHYPRREHPENIAMFASGLGDGFYQAFWGNDYLSRPAMLVVDFNILDSVGVL